MKWPRNRMTMAQQSVSADMLRIRCPVCQRESLIAKNSPTDTLVQCESRLHSFEFRAALPALDKVETARSAVREHSNERRSRQRGMRSLFIIALPSFMLYYGLIVFLTHGMSGPAFLVFYFALFLLCWIVSWIVRSAWLDSAGVKFIAFGLFETAAIIRLIDGWSMGLSKFGLLITMMIIGGFLLLVSINISLNHSSRRRNRRGGFGGGGGCGGGDGGSCGGCGGCA